MKIKKMPKFKRLFKNENLFNFDTIVRLSFLIPNTKTNLNCLQVTFIEIPIFWYFYVGGHILIETNVLSYTINDILSQLVLKNNLDGIVTKIDLG